jgi:hypothetical protein
MLAKAWGREYVHEVDYARVYVRRLQDNAGRRSGRPAVMGLNSLHVRERVERRLQCSVVRIGSGRSGR